MSTHQAIFGPFLSVPSLIRSFLKHKKHENIIFYVPNIKTIALTITSLYKYDFYLPDLPAVDVRPVEVGLVALVELGVRGGLSGHEPDLHLV